MFLDCNEVIAERLWVGRYVRVNEVRQLKLMGITTVISLQSDEDLVAYGIPEKKILNAYAQAGIMLRRTGVRDFDQEAMAQNLPQCVAELETALAPRSARVYLHCTAGINRAPTVAAAYLMKSQGMTAQGAHNLLTSRRNCSPYLGVLENYAAALNSKS